MYNKKILPVYLKPFMEGPERLREHLGEVTKEIRRGRKSDRPRYEQGPVLGDEDMSEVSRKIREARRNKLSEQGDLGK